MDTELMIHAIGKQGWEIRQIIDPIIAFEADNPQILSRQ
jgi:hypothetical protein